MRIQLLANLSASTTKASRVATAARALGVAHDVTVVETTHRGHAHELAAKAAASGADGVAVLGGDGTLNEAANGLLGTSCFLAPLPGGSTNVFARSIGLPRRLEAALTSTLDMLDGGNTRDVGVGMVAGRAFLAHLGAGLDAAVVARADARPDLKRRLGQGWFIAAAVATWSGGRHRLPKLVVHLPDGSAVDGGRFAVALNNDPYTYLGRRPLRVAPDATLDRPLAVVGVADLRLVPLLRVASAALGFGRSGVAGRPGIVYLRDVTEARLTADRPFPYQVDGEHVGEVTDLAVSWRPAALRLLC